MLKTVGNPSTRSGDQTILNGNLVIGTAGKGIDFSADPSAAGMTSELLDDYEEGAWTPTIIGSTSAGVGTYAVGGQQGVYTKVGNLVTVSCWLNWTAHTGTGDMQISGLPFGASASVNVMPGTVYASAFNAGTSATSLVAYATTSPANLALRGFVNSSTRTIPQIQASGQLGITVTYRVV
jgi:hypothetical protein